MRRRLTAAAAFLTITVALAAQTADPEIAKLITQYQAGYNKNDGKALAAMYTADALRLGPTGQLITGRAAIEKDYLANFAGPFKGTKLTLRPGRTQVVKPDVALIEGTYEVAGGAAPVKGRYVNTVVRDGGQWRLASVVTIPEPAPPAK
jgi:uncharacterized protein (TIGR02246 family)